VGYRSSAALRLPLDATSHLNIHSAIDSSYNDTFFESLGGTLSMHHRRLHTPFVLSRVLAVLLVFVGYAFAQKPLRWGADPSGGAPYVYNDPSHPDQYIGYEKEIVDALAAAMGRQAEFVPSDWETLVSALQRKSFDVIVNGLEPTADRQKQILFSKPYYIFQLALTIRSDEQQIHSLADCRNRTVGTLGNTAASRLLEKSESR
jgi:polar amino acid transport system substrate-binding protein